MKREQREMDARMRAEPLGKGSDVLVNGRKRTQGWKSKKMKCEDNLFRGIDRN